MDKRKFQENTVVMWYDPSDGRAMEGEIIRYVGDGFYEIHMCDDGVYTVHEDDLESC